MTFSPIVYNIVTKTSIECNICDYFCTQYRTDQLTYRVRSPPSSFSASFEVFRCLSIGLILTAARFSPPPPKRGEWNAGIGLATLFRPIKGKVSCFACWTAAWCWWSTKAGHLQSEYGIGILDQVCYNIRHKSVVYIKQGRLCNLVVKTAKEGLWV